MDRYKYVVQVMIGEQRGEGVSMSARCFWDQKRDHYVQKTFQNVRRFQNESERKEFIPGSRTNLFRRLLLFLLPGNHILRCSCICSLLLLRIFS